jgi:hypothetical protein
MALRLIQLVLLSLKQTKTNGVSHEKENHPYRHASRHDAIACRMWHQLRLPEMSGYDRCHAEWQRNDSR